MLTGNITFEQVTFGIALLAAIFSVYHFFRKPDIENDKAVCLLKEQLGSAQKLAAETTKTLQNDVHTICGEMGQVKSEINILGKEVTKLHTIIDERIPKK